ncbi:ankyrin repeat-containing domain protein, partial [Lasiosphaeris hirsuta]
TALSHCAESGRELYAKLLVDLGAFLDQPNDERQTPLLWHPSADTEKIVELLLNTGQVNLEALDHKKHTPLLWAVKGEHEDVVRLLLEKGADTGSKDISSGYGETPLSWAATEGCESVARLLLERGVDPEWKDNRYMIEHHYH